MRLQPLYVEDWIGKTCDLVAWNRAETNPFVGLRTLDEQRKVHFLTCDGEHM